ncbi:hypothetical protein IAU59_006863 [Kwoniella sp. CBS 9459]
MGWEKVEQCWLHGFHDCWTHPFLTENDISNEHAVAHFDRPTHIPRSCGGGLQIPPCRDCAVAKEGQCEITCEEDRWYRVLSEPDEISNVLCREMYRVAESRRPEHDLRKIPWDANDLAEERDNEKEDEEEEREPSQGSYRSSSVDSEAISLSRTPNWTVSRDQFLHSENWSKETDGEDDQEEHTEIRISSSSQRYRKRRLIMSRPPSPIIDLAEQLFGSDMEASESDAHLDISRKPSSDDTSMDDCEQLLSPSPRADTERCLSPAINGLGDEDALTSTKPSRPYPSTRDSSVDVDLITWQRQVDTPAITNRRLELEIKRMRAERDTQQKHIETLGQELLDCRTLLQEKEERIKVLISENESAVKRLSDLEAGWQRSSSGYGGSP